MNNEPVAWRTHYPSGWEYKDGNPPFELKGNSQLLYTHPVKEQDTDCQYCKQGCIRCDARKQLTDEEIEELQIQHTEKGHFADTLNVKNFARAILRKASEK